MKRFGNESKFEPVPKIDGESVINSTEPKIEPITNPDNNLSERQRHQLRDTLLQLGVKLKSE